MTSAVADGRQGTVIRVRVTPKSRREEILSDYGEEIRVRLTAPPEKGQANKALIKLLARVLGVPQRELEIASGSTSRRKAVRARNLTAAEVERRLKDYLSDVR